MLNSYWHNCMTNFDMSSLPLDIKNNVCKGDIRRHLSKCVISSKPVNTESYLHVCPDFIADFNHFI